MLCRSSTQDMVLSIGPNARTKSPTNPQEDVNLAQAMKRRNPAARVKRIAICSAGGLRPGELLSSLKDQWQGGMLRLPVRLQTLRSAS